MTSTAIVIRENVPLSAFTTFGVGGPARYFARVSSEEEAARPEPLTDASIGKETLHLFKNIVRMLYFVSAAGLPLF